MLSATVLVVGMLACQAPVKLKTGTYEEKRHYVVVSYSGDKLLLDSNGWFGVGVRNRHGFYDVAWRNRFSGNMSYGTYWVKDASTLTGYWFATDEIKVLETYKHLPKGG